MSRSAAIAAILANPDQAADLMRELINAALHPDRAIEAERCAAGRAAAFLGNPIPDAAVAMIERGYSRSVQ